MKTMTINGHTFELKRDGYDIDVTWTSYMDMKFTFRITFATVEEETTTGHTHFINLKRESRTDWEYVAGLEEPNTKDIYEKIRDVLFGFTQTY
jgi:hypothetical protein